MERIKHILKSKGVTYAELASRMGLSEQSIKQTINRDSMSTATLQRIASAIDVPAWMLLDDAPEDPSNMDVSPLVCPHCGKAITVELK